jgi:hypothetical protein
MVFNTRGNSFSRLFHSSLGILLVTLSLVSCNQEEFYQKEGLPAIGKKLPPPANPGGEGNTDYELLVENFVQNSGEQGVADILWVIDNSGSMGDEQDAIARNFNVFIQEFIQTSADFKMAITTTDDRSDKDGGDGKMFGGNHLALLTDEAANSNEAKFLSDFTRLVKVGVNGSGSERGLNGAFRFFQRNPTFNRSSAHLSVIYVSDEEDLSFGTVPGYIDALKALKTNPGMVKAYSIVLTSASGGNSESVGTRYMQVSTATQGISKSIKSDFADTLSNIGETILKLTSSFVLGGIPFDLNSFQVAVDGVEVKTGWAYDEPTKSIKFEPGSVPREGADVVISYYAKK